MSFSKHKRPICGNLTGQTDYGDVPYSVHMVMNLEELRDMIVDRVILYEHELKDTREKDSRSLRLVSKDWQLSVSRVLYKNGLPVIQIDFNRSYFMGVNQAGEKNAETLDKFVKTYSSAFSANDKNAPTYSLQLHSEFFETGSPISSQILNFPILQECLAQCGKGLVELNVPLPEYAYLPATLPIDLSNLRKLIFETGSIWRVDTTSEVESDTEESQNEIINRGNFHRFQRKYMKKTANFLRHLLEGSSSLEKLTLQNFVKLSMLGLANFLLPSTLTELFVTAFTLRDVEILSRNPLPKLSTLNLIINEAPISNDCFFNALNNWRKTLKILTLEFECEFKPEIRFPVMENLDAFIFHGRNCVLTQTDGSLELCFPNLQTLSLGLTESAYRTWCINSVFQFVENLTIFPYYTLRKKDLPMNLQNIQLAVTAFPNVTSLHIMVLGSETSVLQFIFKEMLQLQSLNLRVIGTETVRSSKFWDTLLVGTTVENAEKLKASLDNPNCAEILENGNIPSVRCLTNLSSLTLSTFGDSKDGDGGQLISEVSFIHGFFKMPEFKVLSLDGRFKIPDEMREFLKPRMGPYFSLV